LPPLSLAENKLYHFLLPVKKLRCIKLQIPTTGKTKKRNKNKTTPPKNWQKTFTNSEWLGLVHYIQFIGDVLLLPGLAGLPLHSTALQSGGITFISFGITGPQSKNGAFLEQDGRSGIFNSLCHVS